jgi:hypothetical protein
MKLKLSVFIFVLCSSLGFQVFCEEEQTAGILYGPNWSCLVQAPDGWIMDQKSMANQGIYGLFYEHGKKLEPQTPIIYINTQKLNADTDEELQKYVDYDIGNYKKDGSNTITLKTVVAKNFPTIISYNLVLENGKQFERILYFHVKDVAFLVVLATHDENQLKTNLNNLAFVAMNMKFMDKK